MFTLSDRLALVAFLFAAGDADENLDSSSDEVEFERHNGQALDRGLLGEFADLASVGKQPPFALRYMLASCASGVVLADVNIEHGEAGPLTRTRLGLNKPLAQAHLPEAHGFHFGAKQFDPAFKCLVDEVVVPGLAVLDDGLVRLGWVLGSHGWR